MTDPVQPRPQPVLDSSKLAGLLGGAFVATAGLVFWFIDGGFNADTIDQAGHLIELAVTAVLALGAYLSSIWHGQRAAKQVTPLSNPVDNQGRPLVVDPAYYGRHAAAPDDSPSMGPDTPEPLIAVPQPVGFPLATYDGFKAYPRSDKRRDQFIAECDAWLDGPG